MSKIVRDKFSGILRDPSGGLNQRSVNKNTIDSKGILGLFQSKYPTPPEPIICEEGNEFCIEFEQNGTGAYTVTATISGEAIGLVGTLRVQFNEPFEGAVPEEPTVTIPITNEQHCLATFSYDNFNFSDNSSVYGQNYNITVTAFGTENAFVFSNTLDIQPVPQGDDNIKCTTYTVV